MERTRLRPPHSYVVIMHNDDETTMDFVVNVLMQIFRLTHNESLKVMLDMARTIVRRAKRAAEAEGFPLDFSIEPVVED